MAANVILLSEFPLNRVHMADPYAINAFEKELQYLNNFDPDRLTAGFREVAGLVPKADKYPGWEQTEIRGHTLGHYLSACGQAYAQTNNQDLLVRLDYILNELVQCQTESGYLSAFSEELFDNVEHHKPAWVPWYTMHKIIAGLLAVYRFTHRQSAYDVVTKLGYWVAERSSKWTPDVNAAVLAVEYGGMNDCLYDLYKFTDDERHLAAAHRFDEISLFEPIRQGKDILKGKHANTTIPKFLGALNRYLTLGENEAAYLEAATQFWDIVVYNHSYITGGNSDSEHFGEPDLLNASRSEITCETCNIYNMLKLTRELFKITRDVKYADFYERAYVNSILSSQNPETGMTMYFQPMATGYFKVYGTPFDHFWCCTGTGMENFTKLNDSIYFHDKDSLYVNQFISSSVKWVERGVLFTQTSSIPDRDIVLFEVETLDREERMFALYVRVPYWVSEDIEVTVNDDRLKATIDNQYLVLERNWKHGDKISIRIPMNPFIKRLPDAGHVVGFQYGPVVLSAGLGTEDMSESSVGIMVSVPTRSMLIKDFFTTKGMEAEEWLSCFDEHFVRKGEELAFVLRNTDEDDRLVFTPHFRQHKERYGIYWSVVEADSAEIKEHIRRAERLQSMKEATIDSVQLGNDQYELQHGIRGERTTGGSWEGFNGRQADADGWFSYRMKVDPGVRIYLSVHFGSWHRSGAMDIHVNGQLLTNERFQNDYKRKIYNKVYPIPHSMLNGLDSAEIMFTAKGATCAVYEVLRIMRNWNEGEQPK